MTENNLTLEQVEKASKTALNRIYPEITTAPHHFVKRFLGEFRLCLEKELSKGSKPKRVRKKKGE